ncbi:MAG: efflux RND transporter permease subunit [Rhizobiaceae bacterium]|jgi:multidrug efflux pump subunit AcrB|nr:efflux RND transporter permease subunit [Rhizobiaceae bacterium]
MDIRQTSLIAVFLRHPNAANLLMVLMVLFGIFGLLRINTQFFPTVETPAVSISITWSGATATDIEAGILAVVEPEVRFINGLKELRSTAREGGGYITLEFDEGTDMQKAAADVEAAVNAITTLPEGADEPQIARSQFFDTIASMSISGDVPEEVLRRWAKTARDRFIAAGIDKVDMSGLRAEEIAVTVSPAALRRHGLTIAEIARIIGANARDVPSGAISGGVERQLRVIAATSDVERLKSIEIRAQATGERLTLGDIATVERVFDDDAIQGYAGTARAIELEVSRAPTADTLETAAIFRTEVERLRPELPQGVTLQVYDVRADLLSDRIWLLVENGLSGLLVVILVLYLFLDGRIAFWIAMGIPVATMATIGILFLVGESINMFSLFGLIMMLGVIVDDAIVVGEHTATRFEMGDAPMMAAQNGVGMMMMPVIAAMATTLAAFFPIALITGTIGQIMGVLPVVVVAVLIGSLIECLFILPSHLAHALEGGPKAPRWSHWRVFAIAAVLCVSILLVVRFAAGGFELLNTLQDMALPFRAVLIAAAALALAALVELVLLAFARRAAARRLRRGGAPGGFRVGFDRAFNTFRDGPISRMAALAYDWRYVTTALMIALFLAIGVGLVRGERVRFAFFPSPEAERVFGRLTLLPGTPEAEVRAALAAVDKSLRETETELGNGAPLISATFARLGAAGRDRGENFAEIIVQLVPSERRDVRTPDFTRAWRTAVPKLPAIQRFAITEARGGPPGRDIDIQLTGPSTEVLKRAGADLITRLGEISGVSGVVDNLPYGKPELILELTPRGAAFGFTIEEVGRQMRDSLDGVVARRFAEGDEEVALRVLRASESDGLAALRAVELRAPSGAFIPLDEIVTITEQQGFAKIEREDGKARVGITGDIDLAANTTDGVIAELRDSGFMDSLSARYGIEYGFGGRAEEQRAAFRDVGIGSLIALATIYIILAWVFGSYSRPAVVMLIIPFGYLGAVIGHWAMGFDLTILSLIGLLGLAGILVNDSIVLVARFDERLANGDDWREAAIGASRDRLRAVLLTSLTTIGGLGPLLFETSFQAQFLLPMAITMVFGLAVATLLVLFLIPALLGIGADINAFFRGLYGRRGVVRPMPAE